MTESTIERNEIMSMLITHFVNSFYVLFRIIVEGSLKAYEEGRKACEDASKTWNRLFILSFSLFYSVLTAFYFAVSCIYMLEVEYSIFI